MKVIWNGKTDEGRVVALGTFDGVHLGHRELLETGLRYAREHRVPLRACTFDRHPLEVIRPETAPKILTTIPERAALMARAGVDADARRLVQHRHVPVLVHDIQRDIFRYQFDGLCFRDRVSDRVPDSNPVLLLTGTAVKKH